MNLLIAPNAFKGTIEADEAAEIIGSAILSKIPDAEVVLCPIADGGDGTCFLLGKALNLKQVFEIALDPLGRPMQGFYFFDPGQKTAYLDVSTVSGIKSLKPHERNPWITSTFGTGGLIKKAADSGAEHIILGLGGSATVDMGIGILRGLGFLFLDEKGREIPVFSEGFISKIRFIQSPIPKPNLKFTCLCDVNNHFFGPSGAIPVFGPQKGLKLEDLEKFEKDCSKALELMAKKSGKQLADKESFGAAGGIAFGLSFFFPVKIEMGAKWFFEKVGIEFKIKSADIIITGEGRYDSQSASGKGSYELLQLAKKHRKKTVLITSGEGGEESGFDQVIQLPELDFGESGFVIEARKNLEKAVFSNF
ncbi:glycerate kinase [Cognataquiflexum rubidum]|uniref:glycerate kinase family protein n=1 Tax=Cognataquiflexum rubidum TaxID=2922273 RepID=UPI001F13208E|nr:glycerate kinase [Cognataquiflexum rubidum]MCH6235001.1 glycerate kinase [Cognataquiflexum rubidum]